MAAVSCPGENLRPSEVDRELEEELDSENSADIFDDDSDNDPTHNPNDDPSSSNRPFMPSRPVLDSLSDSNVELSQDRPRSQPTKRESKSLNIIHLYTLLYSHCTANATSEYTLCLFCRKVYAVERDEGRFQSLKEMIANSGADNVVTLHSDVTKLSLEKYSDVEYILLDPTCSGSGMRDRQPRSSLHSSSDKERLYKLQGFQLTLIRFAFTKFPAAKRVVYSTCSLNVEENEEVVQAALNSKHHEFQLVNVSKKLPGWKSFGSEDFEFGTECIYSRPETDLTNGFFVAVFERKKHYSRDDTRSVPENNQDYIEDMNKKVCENGSSKYKNDDTKVKYNTENDLDRENKSVRGNKNYFNYENNKSEQDTLKKRMHNSNENTDQNSGHKRFFLNRTLLIKM
ncbi:26S rRNA (cytosine-C(5))-methyltransferase NOP2B [Homalodisca vitripennis]|uniref:26S rRNA (cytosine-C(5))-methyltransferase NOP2B n=1 Tax=Homalodisca vitripennis TaxID=197043 RepID=UPI001EEC1FA6|nr:26S rRNA (cytosine-C(5))-methyltransferase NOP2B [Homalodisca vitripennis]